MFWKRETKIVKGSLGPLLSFPIPAKREFQTMLEILRDAEKYDNGNDIEVRNVLLSTLCEHIEIFKTKSKTKSNPIDGGSSLDTIV
ncbi:MAG: hypothetical protein KKD36_09940 [Bacteroidetes bacterium]|nr:hypothetical protein [Bacteroidota bacterium]